jgi:hypothetical protein
MNTNWRFDRSLTVKIIYSYETRSLRVFTNEPILEGWENNWIEHGPYTSEDEFSSATIMFRGKTISLSTLIGQYVSDDDLVGLSYFWLDIMT